ncbi:hypothetical protein BH10ACI3_BH10ACI3_20930 [soil metagenome]
MYIYLSKLRSLAIALIFGCFACAAVSAASYGELDNAFQPSLVKDNQAIGNALLVQPDGKIIYAGFFLTIDRRPFSYIARFNADGTIDNGFDSGNTFTIDASISAVALQPDGKIIVAGSFDKVAGVTRFGVARLNSDGSFDPTFNVAFPSRPSGVTSVAVQPDGKVVIGGSFSTISGQTRNGLARLNTDGSLDTAFNSPCFASSNRAIVVQPDGKLIVGSTCSAVSTNVSRLNTNGTLDTTFDPGTGANGSAVRAIILQPDGKVLVGGQFGSFNGQSTRGLVRLSSTGAIEAAFAPTTNYSTNSIALQSDGKIYIGRDNSFQGVAPVNRLNDDGTIDASFNATESQVNAINALAVSQDGKVYEAGQMYVDGSSFTNRRALLRLTPTGLIDQAFNPFVVYPSLSAGVNNVIAQPDGKILAAGQFNDANRVGRSGLVRFNADGSLDTTFSAVAGLGDGTAVNALALQPDGRILVGSSLPVAGNDRLMRLNPDGSRDTSFNVVVGDSGDSVKFIAVQPDGKIVVAGTFTVIGGQARPAHFARLTATGVVDSFNPVFDSPGNQIFSLLMRPDGRFMISGDFQTVNGINHNTTAGFNADGTLDATFANTNYGAPPFYLALQPDGKIVSSFFGSVIRSNADNTIDQAFTATSFKITGGNSGAINSLAVQQNGKILVVGQFNYTQTGGLQFRTNIARLNGDGTLDPGFGTYGGATGGNVNKVALQADGKVLIGGVFRMVNGFGHSGLARLNPAALQANSYSDFDGDGITDVSVFRGGLWYVNPSSGANSTPIYGLQFGLATDKLAPADYDGDGKTDVAVWREAGPGGQAYFYILLSSSGTVKVEAFGLTGDTIMPGDWDGDGKADVATYREGAQSNFYYRGTLNNPGGGTTYLPWGISGDSAVRGDFDGDGRLDTAVFRPADRTWYIKNSSNGAVTYSQFGLSTDKRLPGDFDGDGKTDIAVFRGGVWYIFQSSDLQVKYRTWGLSGDALTPGDYDGDGRTDVSVYRNGVNYVQYTSNSAAVYQPFGTTGDVPVASAYSQ